MIPENIEKIAKGAIHNAGMVLISRQAACYQCYETYSPSEIQDYCDDGQTCLCPKCGIDSVIFSSEPEGIKVSLLQVMRSYYFRGDKERCVIDSDGKRQSQQPSTLTPDDYELQNSRPN